MNKVRLGIIGLGAQGGTYAGFINDNKIANLELGAICDINPENFISLMCLVLLVAS